MSAVDAPTRVLYSRGDRPPPAPICHSEEGLLEMALTGHLVAEELPTKTRERLFTYLHWLGWTVREIADHTRTTEYTTERIMRRLGLRPNVSRCEAVSA